MKFFLKRTLCLLVGCCILFVLIPSSRVKAGTVNEESSVTLNYTITLHGNGNDEEDSTISAVKDSSIELITPIRNGYNFIEWNTNADGTGTGYTKSMIITKSVDLYTIWEKQPEVALTKTKITLYPGSEYNLILKNADGTIQWSSSNNKIATVNKMGSIKPIKAGNTTITAKYNGVTYSCKVSVMIPSVAKLYTDFLASKPLIKRQNNIAYYVNGFCVKDFDGDGSKELLVNATFISPVTKKIAYGSSIYIYRIKNYKVEYTGISLDSQTTYDSQDRVFVLNISMAGADGNINIYKYSNGKLTLTRSGDTTNGIYARLNKEYHRSTNKSINLYNNTKANRKKYIK